MINLINERCDINQEFQAYPTATLTLSILGTQGSGKSTLLNSLFASDFPVLEASQHRTRCTTGVWLNHLSNYNIIDTEGFDSMERSEDEKIFEKQMSLFCVVISDVVLINLYMDEIGRYTGGHVDILQAIFKVGERLVTPHQKKIVYVIRDTAEDADHSILSKELSEEIKNLSNQYHNKQLKYTIQFHFMSHYIYQPDKFNQQAKQLLPRLSIRRPSAINNYKEADRVKYLHQIWKQIKDSKTELDLKSIDDALKSYVMQRITHEIIDILHGSLGQLNNLEQVKTYHRYVQSFHLTILDYLTLHRPKHIKEKELERHVKKIYEMFQPTATKHFNQNILKNIEDELEAEMEKEIKKHKKNKKLSHLIFKKKKEVTDIYKKTIEKHHQYTLLIKNFHERMSSIIQQQQNKLNHLFSLFQNTVERQLNKTLDTQASELSFDKQEISNRIKELCQEYQYNEWEVDFAQIWEKVSYRCIEKVIPEVIEQKSLNSMTNMGVMSGDQTTSIIAIHTTLEKRALDFCRDILYFLHEENTLTQPLSQIKERIRDCLYKRLAQEQRRWKISLFLLSFALLLLYGQLEIMLKFTSMKKRKRRFYLRIYYWSSLAVFLYCLFKEAYVFKKKKNGQK